MSPRNRIEQQLRDRVCSVCYAELREHSCGAPAGRNCPLFQRLDSVISAISGTRGEMMRPYEDSIRTIVCSTCRMQKDGFCDRREVLDCALDMYLPLVVEIVESNLPNRAVLPPRR